MHFIWRPEDESPRPVVGQQSSRGRLLNRIYIAFILAIGILVITAVGAGAGYTPHLFLQPEETAIVTLEDPRRLDGDPDEGAPLIVDTDGGVDDAAALAWLLTQEEYDVDLLGITTVAGNTSVENATNNTLIFLEAAGRTDVPVVIGAAAPLVKPLSLTPWFLHGPDGLWFVGLQNPHDLSGLPTDAPAFYRDAAVNHPGATLLALGPLTNIAQAIDQYPAEMALLGEIVVLGGAKFGGNTTPVSEYNLWQDPDAAVQVLNAGIPITMLTLDGFEELEFKQKDVEKLADKGNAAAQLLAIPLQFYADVQFQQGAETFTIPDVAAVIYYFEREWGDEQSGLVKPVTDASDANGQTIIGLTLNERVTMIGDDAELSNLTLLAFTDPTFDLQAALGAILSREPDNAWVVMDIDEKNIRRQFMKDMTD